MRKFLRTIALTLLLTALLMEVLLRIFSLASHVPEEVNLDGDRMYRPGMEAPYTAGGMGEIRGRYQINAQGWNSVLDYGVTGPGDSADSSSPVRIAIIGDSYIEGMQGDVATSIGRILEGLWPGGQEGRLPDGQEGRLPGCVVHEYGKAGGNIADHALVYEKWVLGRYDHVFVLVTNDDLIKREPWYMGRGASYKGVTGARRIYYSSALLRYLGLNHKLGMRLKAMLNERVFEQPLWQRLFGPGTSSGAGNGVGAGNGSSTGTDTVIGTLHLGNPAPENFLCMVNRQALDHLEGNSVFLHEEGKLNPSFLQAYPCLEIRHTLEPYNFGFDGHWNLNGRRNCAKSIITYLGDAR